MHQLHARIRKAQKLPAVAHNEKLLLLVILWGRLAIPSIRSRYQRIAGQKLNESIWRRSMTGTDLFFIIPAGIFLHAMNGKA